MRKLRRRLNCFLLLLLIVLLSLIIEKKDEDSFLAFKKIREKVFFHSNVIELSTMYNGVFFPLATSDVEVASSLSDYIIKPFYQGAIIECFNEVILCVESGVVVEKGVDEQIGNYVIIKCHNNREYRYGMLASTSVNLYEYVPADKVVGFLSMADSSWQGYIEIFDNEYLSLSELS